MVVGIIINVHRVSIMSRNACRVCFEKAPMSRTPCGFCSPRLHSFRSFCFSVVPHSHTFFFSDFRFFDRPKSFRFQSKLVLVALYILHWLTFHSTVWSFGHQFLLFSSFIRRLFRVLSSFDGPKIISLHFHNSSEQLSELYELNSFWKKSTTFDRKKIRYFYFQFHVAQTIEIAMKMKMKSLFLSMANMIDFHTCY